MLEREVRTISHHHEGTGSLDTSGCRNVLDLLLVTHREHASRFDGYEILAKICEVEPVAQGEHAR